MQERQPTPCQQQQGQLVVGVAVGALGQMIGIPFGVGFMAGSIAFQLIDQPKVYGPKLNDTKVRGADYGQMVTILYGMCRIGGWGEGQGSTSVGPNEFTPHEESSGGSKGGPEQINTRYTLSFFNGICEGPIKGVWRRWANGRLITEGNAASSPTWPYTLYLGNSTQMPDPTMELVYGVGEVCPMRGRAYESVEEVDVLDFSNARPNVEYEAYTAEGVFPWRVSHFLTLPTGFGISPHRTQSYANGIITIGAYCGDGRYYEEQFEIDGTPVPFTATNNALVGGAGGVLFGVDGLNAGIDGFGSGWYQKEVFITPLLGNIYDNGGNGGPVYYNDFIFSLGVNGLDIGMSRWPATGGVITAATGTPDVEVSIGTAPGDSPSGFILGRTNRNNVYLFFSGTPKTLYEYAFDLSSIVRQWDLTAAFAVQPIINGAGFTVYENINGELILACDRGNSGGKNAGAFYLNSDLSVTFVGKVDAIDAFTGDVALLGTSGYALVYDGVISLIPPPAQVTLGSIVADLLQRAGLNSGQYDVSDLTQLVRGFVVASQMTIFNAIDTLRRGFFFDVTEYDGKIVCRNRGHGATETIPDGDLCAHVLGTEPPEPLEVMRVPELELPRTVYINFYNYDNDYQTGSQYWRRTVTLSQSDVTLDLPIVFTAGEAQAVAQWHMHFAWLERDRFTFYVTEAWQKLRPTNVVVVRGVNIRITNVVEMPTGIIKCEGVRAFAGAFTGTHITDPIPGEIPGDGGSGQPPQTPPSGKADTGLMLIDGPWISEADSPTAVRAALYKNGSGAWSGASLNKSVDGGTTYPVVASLSSPSIVGTVATALPVFTGGNVVDEANVIRVTLVDSTRTLSSTTTTGLLNGLNLIALGSPAAGWEFLQYRTATLVSVGVWDLSGLYRYRFGTDWKTHAASEVFVVISSTIMVPGSFAEINVARKYKAVTFGTAIADALAVDFTNTAVALKPLSPVLLGGGRNASGDLTLNWIPRRRGSGGWPDGLDLPPTDLPESYILQFATDSTFATIVRQPGSLTPTYTYTAAMQTTDFGSPQAVVNWRVAQVGSAAWGYFTKAAT